MLFRSEWKLDPRPPYRRENQSGGTFAQSAQEEQIILLRELTKACGLTGQTNIAMSPELYVLGGQVCAVNPQSQSPEQPYVLPAHLVRGFSGAVDPGGDSVDIPRDLLLPPLTSAAAPVPGNRRAWSPTKTTVGRLDYSHFSRDPLFGRYVIDWADQTNPFAGSRLHSGRTRGHPKPVPHSRRETRVWAGYR
jgi:hypothetical protein